MHPQSCRQIRLNYLYPVPQIAGGVAWESENKHGTRRFIMKYDEEEEQPAEEEAPVEEEEAPAEEEPMPEDEESPPADEPEEEPPADEE